MLKKWISITKNLFFPLSCLNCGKKIRKDYLCLPCQNQIKLLSPPDCYTQIKINRNYRNGFTVISSCNYRGAAKALIHSFKYRHCDFLADTLSRLMIKQLNQAGFNPKNYDFIVPVPLNRYKLKQRGYNQAKLLAKQLAKYLKIPLKDDIISSKYIKDSQTKLSPKKRKENVKGKFRVKNDMKNKKIVLVDDVLTTGATLSACWQSLKEKGAEIIYPVTLAK